MKPFEWVVDWKDYDEQRLDRPSAETARKYYAGFKLKMINRRHMFQDELKDLEMVYENSLEKLQKQVEDCLPSLLYYMQEFITLHKQNEAIREKLDVLLAKTGRELQEDFNGGDDE